MTQITDLSIRNAIAKVRAGANARIELRDGGERGAGRLVMLVRKTTDGHSAEWYAQWHRDGARLTTKLGSYPSLGLAAARKLFREEFAPEILAGRNPSGSRSWTHRRGATVRDLFEAYVEHLEARKKPAAYAARRLLLGPKGAADAIGANRPASDVGPKEIAKHLAAIHGRGTITEANSSHAYIRAAFNFGIRSIHCYFEEAAATDWGLKSNPASCVPVNKLAFRPRDRTLNAAEFRSLWEWLASKEGRRWFNHAPALRLMMATGQRPGEILRLGVANYDRERGLLHWPKTKNGRQHCIPLPRQAVEILEALTPNEHGLFFPRKLYPEQPSPTYVGGFLLRRFRRETGAEDFTMRDFRRTWKTEAGAAGVPKDIRDRIQNHALTDVGTRYYDRWSYMPEKRAAMVLWEPHLDWLLGLGGASERRSDQGFLTFNGSTPRFAGLLSAPSGRPSAQSGETLI